MASNVSPRQRAFALTIALIFLVTTVATSVIVVMAIIDDNKQKNTDISSQTNPAANAQTDPSTCAIDLVQGQAMLPVPEVFKPTGDVTALETTDLEAGSGDVIKAGDCIVAKYYGTLASNGEKFDENFTQEAGLVFKVGAGNVIAGWDEGIVGMKVGGTRRLVIPADKAYGEAAQGSIPANADLVFVVKVTEIKK